MIQKRKISIKSVTDDLSLKANITIPDKAKAVVQIIHGMSEHKERYEMLSNILARFGCVVVAADNRGHGESISTKVPLGYFASKNGWQVNVDDQYQVAKVIREEYSNLPFFLIGHSMGSLIAHSYLKKYEDSLSGVIFSGMPAYNKAASSGKKLASILSKGKGEYGHSKALVGASDFNKAIKNPKTPFDWLSYNVDNVQAYIEDPLCGFPFTNKGYGDLLDGMMDVFSKKGWNVKNPNLPVLFVAGQDDPCADVPEGFQNSLNNLARAGYQNIEANVYENMRHEIFNERERKIVYKDILTWMQKQLKAIEEAGKEPETSESAN